MILVGRFQHRIFYDSIIPWFWLCKSRKESLALSPLVCITGSCVSVEVKKSRFANYSILSALIADFLKIKTTVETTSFVSTFSLS